ncbi:MAG: M23 family metallopeptidase [Candidatus Levybacteria bacterium]|nr:M23 family metallopeptidase [Candidatus Levybacteria bacterium]MBI2622626.1 M23 family metallopeptidase [Candidatus Levybacteria bacterium]MBI3092759.1 M23 family metallopeptidase [Candidatus Levybacteria bacterium]
MKKQLDIKFAIKEFSAFCIFLGSYLQKKIVVASLDFEKKKAVLVRFFLMRRGRYNRPFLHITAMVVLGIGVLTAPFLADTYPIFSSSADISNVVSYETAQQSITLDQDVFQTEISQKPRDKIITYTVERGDTLSTIAEKFGISVETIKWANDLTSDDLSIGDTLKILPVTGIAHKVSSGDNVYTIAKKYDANAQAIADFPFNEFANPETFSLVVGQILIVPDGIKPSEQPFIRRQVYIASGPVSVSAAGFTWPLQGVISQFAAWYHMAVDITSPLGTPVVAAQNGTVTKALAGVWDGGYGTNLEIDGGNGYKSLYSHLSGLNVSIGDEVVAGKTVIGWVGLTGRTTGPHVHFEIRKNGVLVNPLPYLQ